MDCTRKTLKSFSQASWFCEPFCPCPTPLGCQWREIKTISVVSSTGNYVVFHGCRKGGRAGDNRVFSGAIQKIFGENGSKEDSPGLAGVKFRGISLPVFPKGRRRASARPDMPSPRFLPSGATVCMDAGTIAGTCPCPTPSGTPRPSLSHNPRYSCDTFVTLLCRALVMLLLRLISI